MKSESQMESVIHQRHEVLSNLRHQVNNAFKNPRVTHLEGGEPLEDIDLAKREALLTSGLPDDAVLHIDEFRDDPSLVFVTNPHDYRDLLIMVWKRVLLGGARPQETPEQWADKTLEHEFSHHVPGLGQEKLEIRYAVEFVRNADDPSSLAVVPSLMLKGEVLLGVYREMGKAPDKPSKTDLIKMGME